MNSLDLKCHTCEGRKKGVFCNLNETALDRLDRGKNFNVYKKGQKLFSEGNPAYGLYCLHSGKVKLSKTNSEGKETIVRLSGPGDILGHRSLFSDSPYTATASVLEEAIVCFVSKTTVYDLMQKDPNLSIELMSKLGKQMGAAEEKVASLAQKNQRERFAEMLLFLTEAYGEEEQGRVKLNIKLTREEMASMIGAAQENLIRLVSDFKKAGVLEQEGKTLYIRDMKTVKTEANLDVDFY